MSPILVTLTSRCDSDFECSNISFSENILNGVDLNSNGLGYCVRKKGGKFYGFRQTVVLSCHKPENCKLTDR